ncbi:hypothetical protein EJ06DRAFT_316036 [Trichodelitschia bisporula]|uniref:Uncharacterized protein n=1 Tax=Trichodelitschia bisporula TaxID=703511 RepID=A0A6G1I459_9PEZI|nr:hypothetical protein EJ06DRAFT_316036 [Trichodelitschia bisporula]
MPPVVWVVWPLPLLSLEVIDALELTTEVLRPDSTAWMGERMGDVGIAVLRPLTGECRWSRRSLTAFCWYFFSSLVICFSATLRDLAPREAMTGDHSLVRPADRNEGRDLKGGEQQPKKDASGSQGAGLRLGIQVQQGQARSIIRWRRPRMDWEAPIELAAEWLQNAGQSISGSQERQPAVSGRIEQRRGTAEAKSS